jgi:3-phosphoshikimate 1-carboxyvinyltransferase
MLKLFKAGIKHIDRAIVIKGNNSLVSPGKICIPGDISSAAFFVVSAAIIPNSDILIKNSSLNPSRFGFVKVLQKMGANIKIKYNTTNIKGDEPAGSILVKSSRLKGVRVSRVEIPSLIDELPILMVAASYAVGKTIFEGVEELRIKETDRINSMLINLKKMGANIKVVISGKSENIIVQGTGGLKGANLKSFGDHRTAMSLIVAGLAAKGKSRIDDVSCINKSLPEFLKILNSLK